MLFHISSSPSLGIITYIIQLSALEEIAEAKVESVYADKVAWKLSKQIKASNPQSFYELSQQSVMNLMEANEGFHLQVSMGVTVTLNFTN